MTSTTDVLKDLLCGCMSGWGQVLTMMPFENIKVKVILKPLQYTSYAQCVMKTIKEEGILAFYKGMAMPLLGVGAQVGVQFGIVETAKKTFKTHFADKDGKLGFQFSFLSGIISGIPSAMLVTPLDHARFRVAIIKEAGVGSLKMAQNIYSEHGFRKLYTGFYPTLLRECIGLGFYFCSYDVLISFFKQNNNVPIMGSLLSGGLAGVMFWISIYPFDYVKTLLQTASLKNPAFTSATHCAKVQFQKYGAKVFFTGLSIMLARAFVINSVGFLCFEIGKKYLYSK